MTVNLVFDIFGRTDLVENILMRCSNNGFCFTNIQCPFNISVFRCKFEEIGGNVSIIK